MGVNVQITNPFSNPGGWKRDCLISTQDGNGDWFCVLRTEETAQQNRDVVHYGETVRLMHKTSGLFLGVVEAESQLVLSFDQISDERQHHVCLLPNTHQPECKAAKLHWVFSWENYHSNLPVCFFPSQKACLFLTNPSSKLKLHSHEIPVFGEN